MSEILNQYLKKINFNEEDLQDFLAIGGIIVRENKILMMDHVKFNFWTIPIGKVKSHETVIEGLKTEMKEELNIDVTNQKLITIWKRTFNWRGKRIKTENHLFKINSWRGRIRNNEPKKHRSIKFMTIDEIRKIRLSEMTKVMLKAFDRGKFKL